MDDIKKRHRITLVCNYCKKRKVKCDKGKPCSACVKHNVGHLCSYEAHNPWSEPSSGHEGIGSLPDFVVALNSSGPAQSLVSLSKAAAITPPLSTVEVKKTTSTLEAVKPKRKILYPLQQGADHSSNTFQVHQHPAPTPAQTLSQTQLSQNNNHMYQHQPLQPLQVQHQHQHQHQLQAHQSLRLPQPHSISEPSTHSIVPLPNSLSVSPFLLKHPLPKQSEQTTRASVVHSELEFLKDRIKQIEASITLSQLPPTAAHSPRGSYSGQHISWSHAGSPLRQIQDMNYNGEQMKPTDIRSTSHTDKGSNIQLPPISWANKKYNACINNCIDNPKHPVNTNPRPPYVGVNPVDSEHDTMNFFEGYSSIHIRDSSKRMNCGPFAWLSLMKKDRAMLVMWKQILNPNSTRLKNVMLLSGIYPKSVKSGNDSKKGTELRKSLSDETDTDRNTSTTSNHNLNYDPPISLPSASVSRNANIILNSIDINGHIKKKFKCSDPETRFREKALDRDGYNDIRPYDKLRRSNNIVNVDESESEHTKTKYEEGNRERIKPKNNVGDQEKHSANLTTDRTRIQKMNENTISLGLTLFEGKVDQELKLIEKLQVVLPERKVVWLLINKFFTDMYPYLPMIDEFDFKKEIARILGPRTSLNEIYLKVEKRLDFATLAILLIMLRFTYLSLFCNRSALNEQHLNSTDPSVRAQEIKFLMSNPISMDIIDMAQLCIDQFLLLQQSNLIVLQCLFFMRLYRKYAPEEGDGVDGGDSQIATGMLVQMGFLLGLNREPDAFKDVFNDERENNLSRKLWNLLVSTDLVQSFSFGNPLNIHTKYYDTKLPHYKIGNENISDAELEKHVLNDTILSGRFLRKIKELLDMTISISERVNLKELTDKLSEIEIKIHENLGELKDFLVPFDPAKYYAPFIKAESCKKLFLLKYFELSILMHIFLEYEKRSKRDLSFFYLRKLVSISCRELMPHYLNLIWDMHINFDTAAILALTPTIEETIHKTNQISFIVIIRLNVSIYQMKSDPNHDFLMANNLNYSSMFRQLCKLSCNMERCVEFCLSALDKLKSRYYYAWRVVKSHTFILKKMYEEDIYKTLDADEFQFLSISLPEIEELIQITEIPVSKYKKTKMYRDQEEKRNYEKMDEIRRKQTFDETGDATGDSKPPSENYRHLLYTLNQESTQMSESLTSISDFDEGVDNVAIDTLWYQLASKKNHGDNNKNNIIATNNNSENQNVNNLNNTNDVNQNGQYMDQPTNVTGNQFVESNFDQFGPNEATTDGIEYQQLGSFGTTPHPLEDPAQFMWDLDLYPIDLFDFQSISNQVP